MKNGKESMATTETKEVKTKAQKYLDLKAKLAQYETEAETEALDALKEPLAVLEQLGKPHVVISTSEYEALKAAKTSSFAPRASKGAGTGKVSARTADGYNPDKSCAYAVSQDMTVGSTASTRRSSPPQNWRSRA